MFIKENHDLKRGGNRKHFELGRWQNSIQKKKEKRKKSQKPGFKSQLC